MPPVPDISAQNVDNLNTGNPKDLIGIKKPGYDYIPPGAILVANAAMCDGAVKYGPFNWRESGVKASVYINAAKRHMDQWTHGNECADDSGVHHLGHALACIAIILDAQQQGMLIDDRPAHKVPLDDIIKVMTKD
jgi:hypothetical protein